MRRFHGSGTATCHHVETHTRQPLGQKGNLAEHRIRAFQCVTTHHPHAQQVVVGREETIERHMHGIVVHRSRERFSHALGMFAVLNEMAVNTGVETGLECSWLIWVETLIQRKRSV